MRAAEGAVRARSRLVKVLPDRRRALSATKNPFLRTDPSTPPERLGPTGARLPAATEPRGARL